MKFRILAALLSSCMLAPAAFAADLPSRKAPPTYVAPDPVATWSGLYVGINGGYAWGDAKFQGIPGGSWIGDPDAAGIIAASRQSMSLSGGAIGGTVGFNHQWDRFVAGIEFDGGWMGLRDPVMKGPFPGALGGFYTVTNGASSNYLLTLLGRLGYTFTPTVLGFVSGGLAVSDVHASQSIYFNNPAPPPDVPPPPPGLPITTAAGGFNAGAIGGARLGWGLGGGFEWMFARNWSAKIEFVHADFGSQRVTSAYIAPAGTVWTVEHRFRRDVNIVRVGLNYHFHSTPDPVIAKY